MFNLLKISLSIFITLFFGSFAFAEETEEDLKVAKLNGAEFVHLDNGFKVWTKRVGNGPVKILHCTEDQVKHMNTLSVWRIIFLKINFR